MYKTTFNSLPQKYIVYLFLQGQNASHENKLKQQYQRNFTRYGCGICCEQCLYFLESSISSSPSCPVWLLLVWIGNHLEPIVHFFLPEKYLFQNHKAKILGSIVVDRLTGNVWYNIFLSCH